MPVYENMNELVGSTPLVRLNRMPGAGDSEVLVKLETRNPTSSVKDRIGLSMVLAAERSGALRAGGMIVEATSGNTGIALAHVGAVRGYSVILTMPETMSVERRRLLQAFGARVELTPGPEGMNGAVARAKEIVDSNPGAVLMQQFRNQANPQIHEETTAEEIWRDTEGDIDVFVAGVGTGGTLTGVARTIRSRYGKSIRVVAIEPDTSPVLSGGKAGPHRIQGIGAGFVPEVLDRSVIDEIMQVSAEDATRAARDLARLEGILGGVSAGANVFGALQLASRPEHRGKRIVTVICDTGERYLSTWLYQEKE